MLNTEKHVVRNFLSLLLVIIQVILVQTRVELGFREPEPTSKFHVEEERLGNRKPVHRSRTNKEKMNYNGLQAEKKITKVNELVKIIEKSKKKNFSSKINPSTKTFQALRIYVNKEISELINGITKATKMLKPGGKLVIISFHSIEDKIVKYFFSNFSKNRSNPSRYLPEDNDTACFLFEKYNKKVIKPTSHEIKINNPSRSAKMRFAIRSKNQFLFPQNLFKKFSNNWWFIINNFQ